MYRATGIVLQNLMHSSQAQMDLFGERGKVDKFESIHKEMDKLEQKFGRRVVHLASTSKANGLETEGRESDDLDRNLLFM